MNIIEAFALVGGPQPRVQFLRPNGNFNPPAADYQPYGAAELWECVDDVTPDEDVTYVLNESGNDFWQPSLSGLTFDWSDIKSRPHTLVVRAKYVGATSIVPWFRCDVLQDPTLDIQQNPQTTVNTEYEDYEFPLSQWAIDKITNYDELFLSMHCDFAPNPTCEIRWTQIFLQIGEEA